MAKTLTRSEMRQFSRDADEYEAKAERLRRIGRDAEAARKQATADAFRAEVKAAKQAAEEARLAELRMKREAKERQEAAEAKRKAEAEARAEAADWFRSAGRFSGGRPQPAAEALKAAERAGIDPDALEAATVRVKRRKDGTECLARPSSYLRRDFIEIEREPLGAA